MYGVTELRSAGRFSLVSCLCLSNLISSMGYGVAGFVIVYAVIGVINRIWMYLGFCVLPQLFLSAITVLTIIDYARLTGFIGS